MSHKGIDETTGLIDFRSIGTSFALYRSGHMRGLLPDGDKVIRMLGIKHVVDLRTPNRVKKTPDVKIRGIQYHYAPLPAYVNAGGLVAHHRANLALALAKIASLDAPALIHCTHGRDRTGAVAAIIELSTGTPVDMVASSFKLAFPNPREQDTEWNGFYRVYQETRDVWDQLDMTAAIERMRSAL